MKLSKLRKSLKEKEPEATIMKAQVDTSITGVAREILLWASMKGY
jgi:hypothetical protein